jgi:hypothetical protein
MSSSDLVLTLHGPDAEDHCRRHPAWPSTRFSLPGGDVISGPLAIGRNGQGPRRCYVPPSPRQRVLHSSAHAKDAKANLRATASQLWGETDKHRWASSGDMETWIPTTNPWKNARFAEHAKWLRDRATDAANDRADMRTFPRDPAWRRRQELEMRRPLGSRPLIHDLVDGMRGSQRQQAHANDLLAAIGAQPEEGPTVKDEMIDQPVQCLVPTIAKQDDIGSSVESAHNMPLTATGMLDQARAAKYLSRDVRTLHRWRAAKIGPTYYVMGGRYYYKPKDLADYVEECRYDPLAS